MLRVETLQTRMQIGKKLVSINYWLFYWLVSNTELPIILRKQKIEIIKFYRQKNEKTTYYTVRNIHSWFYNAIFIIQKNFLKVFV